ncbi:hypothetical protein FGE12_17630 [Aggregicoccus sp. 17bor-14]|nr:Ig-like domain-containing protein [Simulacricoccus sp. 17bor-14]MRI89973.1 hypothetical protein [Aggregicoccus sp. 17bor-14]
MLLVAAPASAESYALLGPTAEVPPEGFAVAVVRRDDAGALAPLPSAPKLSARGAELRPGPSQPPLSTVWVLPQAGARVVELRAEVAGHTLTGRYVLGPPARRVELTLQPPAPVKGHDREAELTVRLRREDGSPDTSGAPPVVRANVGQVEALTPAGPGLYRARYVLPPTRFPEVAILVALSPWPHAQAVHGAYGSLRVPLAASVELPGRTERDASMAIEIAGVRYGPVRADHDGRFRLPVVIPPGHRFGRGRVVDPVGNVRNQEVDLLLPPTDGLACVLHPGKLPADGSARARLLCATSDPEGRPVRHARVEARGKSGRLEGPVEHEDGLLEWRYVAPRASQALREELSVAWPQRGAASREQLELQLVPGGTPVSLALSLGPEPVHHGTATAVRVEARDAAGAPRPGAPVALEASLGSLATRSLRTDDEGTAWQVPEAGEEATGLLTARALGVRDASPARLWLWAQGGELRVGVSELSGLPLAQQPLVVNGEARETGADGTLSLGALRAGRVEVHHAQWPGLARSVEVLGPQGPVFPEDPALVPAPVQRAVRLAPATPVNVRLQTERLRDGRVRVSYWVEDARGQLLEGRKVHVALSEGEPGPSETSQGRTRFTLERPAHALSVSVADVATGVTALAELRP